VNEAILIVDDDRNILDAFGRQFRNKYRTVAAENGQHALALLDGGEQFAVVVADMCMPGMSGIDLLRAFRERSPDTVRVMLTGHPDVQTAAQAINEGHIFRYLTKPSDREALQSTIEAGIAEHRRIVRQKELETELRKIAYTDELTQINNRRRFMDLADRELARAKRFGHSVSVGMIDVDDFKAINDDFGHAVGDVVLQELARAIAESMREIDVFGRYGGEEFVMLLVETDTHGAVSVAERIRQKVSRIRLAALGDRHVSVSIGIASLHSGETLGELLTRADVALYAAKEAGRDRVETYRAEVREGLRGIA
jgi:diguanylate cyclase (GGDEF)-like protein